MVGTCSRWGCTLGLTTACLQTIATLGLEGAGARSVRNSGRAEVIRESLWSRIYGSKLFCKLKFCIDRAGGVSIVSFPSNFPVPSHWRNQPKARGDRGPWVMYSIGASHRGHRTGFYSFVRKNTYGPNSTETQKPISCWIFVGGDSL